MKSNTHAATTSLFDMERLARIFTWLTVGLLVFMLGMIFMNVIDAATVSQTTGTTTTTTTPTATTPAATK